MASDYPAKFKTNLIQLCNDMKDIIAPIYEKGLTNINPQLIEFVSAFLNTYDTNQLFNNFISYSCDYWGKIKAKDESFFIENAKDIFRDLPVDNIDPFKEFFEGSNIEDEDKDLIWEYFTSFVKLSLRHIHTMRCPAWKENDGNYKKVYSNQVYMEVKNLTRMAKEFDIKLEWPAKPN